MTEPLQHSISQHVLFDVHITSGPTALSDLGGAQQAVSRAQSHCAKPPDVQHTGQPCLLAYCCCYSMTQQQLIRHAPSRLKYKLKALLLNFSILNMVT
jgi:hypothetical protein